MILDDDRRPSSKEMGGSVIPAPGGFFDGGFHVSRLIGFCLRPLLSKLVLFLGYFCPKFLVLYMYIHTPNTGSAFQGRIIPAYVMSQDICQSLCQAWGPLV